MKYAVHLTKDEVVKQGSYYTPKKLVDKVHRFITPYIEQQKPSDTIVFDNAGGLGAFLDNFNKCDYRIADKDNSACEYLTRNFDSRKVFCENSLSDVSRPKYDIPNSAYLIMVGNPPYNDTTSEFRNGQKGKNNCDEDLFDRDLGVSFLKSYNKLDADLICILHPLSYLIKEANFKRLRKFRQRYKLKRAEVFPSSMFKGTGSSKFPILIALYERDKLPMSYDYIRNFKFEIFDSNQTFCLNDFQTTDGIIKKYPPRKYDIKESPIGLYYYTFRDINSLRKNASFMTCRHSNAIVVTIENFYQYAYLYCFKNLFNPQDIWLYGNLSPLVCIDDLEKNKSDFVSYAISRHKVFSELDNAVIDSIKKFYNIEFNFDASVEFVESKIIKLLSKLISSSSLTARRQPNLRKQKLLFD